MARNFLRSNSLSCSRPEKHLDTFSNFFYINICNIRGLSSNVHSVNYHFFFTEKQVFRSTCLQQPLFCSLLSLSYISFQGWMLCLCTQLHYLPLCPQPWLFRISIGWFKCNCHSITKYICAVYLSLKSVSYVKFF